MSRGFVVGVAMLLLAGGAGACSTSAPPDSRAVVTVFGPYRDEEALRFMADLQPWASEHGILVRYTGSENLAQDLEHRVENADPPDIALVPQPGLVSSMFGDGAVRELPPDVAAIATRNYAPSALDLGMVDGTQVGFPYRINVKSLLWYRPETFASLGLEPPTTLDDLEKLVADIEAKGVTPWCFGIEAESATGWAATDWVEDLVVRRSGTDVYRDWIAGRVRFDDPRIEAAFEELHDLVLQPRRVVGGIGKVVGTPVTSAGAPLFTDPPGCVLYHQASFALGWMPAGTSLGPDGDVAVLVLPGTSDAAPPIEVGVDLAVAFTDRPEVDQVMAFLAGPEAVETWTGEGGFLSPLEELETGDLAQESDREIFGLVERAPALVIDASDAMAPDIGTDLFWDQITRWVAGSITYEELASTLDDARSG